MNIESQNDQSSEMNNEMFSFKSRMGGYDKKEVKNFIHELKNAANTSMQTYKEKIEELQNNLKMATKELEIANQKVVDTEESYHKICEKMKTVQDQSDQIELLMQENADMKERLKENEDYIKASAELKVLNAQLEEDNAQYEKTQSELEARVKELKKQLYELDSAFSQSEYKYKTETAALKIKTQMAEQRRVSEINKTAAMLEQIQKSLEMFKNKESQ